MKLLKRNETTFEYMPLKKKTEILDGGRHTGRYVSQYGGRVTYHGNVAMPTGYVQATWFGIDKDYSHILVIADPKADIKEEGLIEWQDNTYVIQAVRPSINFLSVAMRRITEEEAKALKEAEAANAGGESDG